MNSGFRFEHRLGAGVGVDDPLGAVGAGLGGMRRMAITMCKSYIADVGFADSLAARVTGAFDIDFVVETQKKVLNRPARFVAIEAKASSEWRSEWNRPLAMIAEHGAIDAAYGVYLGKKTIANDAVTVLPFART